MFYIVRLFIYNREAQDKTEVERTILTSQFQVMIRRLWFGITWPSAILTLIFGLWSMYAFGYFNHVPSWLWIKLAFVVALYIYHFTLHGIYKQQMKGRFGYTSTQLRIWNEIATVFLLCIVMLVVVRQNMSFMWGLAGLIVFIAALMTAIKIYKIVRK